MKEKQINLNLPNFDQLSILAAMIILAHSLNRFMEIPSRSIDIQLPGLFINLEINANLFTAIWVAGMTAIGIDWLLRGHPGLANQRIFPHVLLPAITALLIGIPLNRLPLGLGWWVGLFIGTLLLMMVIIAEYIAFDPYDIRQSIAAVGLSSVSFVILLIIASSLQAAEARQIFMLPAMGIIVWLVCLRSLHLRLHGVWAVYEAALVALVVVQIAAAIHYWPLTPIRFGLICLGPAYALTSLFIGLIEFKTLRELITEPVLVLLVCWLGAIILV